MSSVGVQDCRVLAAALGSSGRGSGGSEVLSELGSAGGNAPCSRCFCLRAAWVNEDLRALCGICRLEFEARNQKKEAKELAVLEAMRRLEQEKH